MLPPSRVGGRGPGAKLIRHGGVCERDGPHRQPRTDLRGLAQAARAACAAIHGTWRALEVIRTEGKPAVRLAQGSVSADYLGLACNGHLDGLEPRIASAIMPINNFMIATAPPGEASARSLLATNTAGVDGQHMHHTSRR